MVKARPKGWLLKVVSFKRDPGRAVGPRTQKKDSIICGCVKKERNRNGRRRTRKPLFSARGTFFSKKRGKGEGGGGNKNVEEHKSSRDIARVSGSRGKMGCCRRTGEQGCFPTAGGAGRVGGHDPEQRTVGENGVRPSPLGIVCREQLVGG